MSASNETAGAWGGDPLRKRTSIAAARKALESGPVVMCSPPLRLGAAGQANDPSNIYCAAYGTDDPAELEARAGVPTSTLMLVSATLGHCEYWAPTGEGDQRAPRMAAGLEGAPIDALEAIRAGADPTSLERCYVVDLLRRLTAIQDRGGRGLNHDQQALMRQLASLHDDGSTDPATFRAVRRMATEATDAATGELETTVLRFVESVAWPLGGLSAELPWITSRVNFELRTQLAPERPSVAEQATLEALATRYRALNERYEAEPDLDFKAELGKIKATPEFAAANEPAFMARLQGYDAAAVEAYAPFAVGVLVGAFSRA